VPNFPDPLGDESPEASPFALPRSSQLGDSLVSFHGVSVPLSSAMAWILFEVRFSHLLLGHRLVLLRRSISDPPCYVRSFFPRPFSIPLLKGKSLGMTSMTAPVFFPTLVCWAEGPMIMIAYFPLVQTVFSTCAYPWVCPTITFQNFRVCRRSLREIGGLM